MSDDDYIIEEPDVPAPRSRPTPARSKAPPKDADEHLPPTTAAKTGAKSKGANPRDGKVKKQKGKAAEHLPGSDAAPSVGFDAEAAVEACNLWWEAGKGDNFIVNIDENWDQWPESSIKKHVKKTMKAKGMFVALNVRKDSDEVVSEMDEVLLHTRTKRRVDEMLPGLAGYHAGKHDLRGGRRVIVQRSPSVITAVKGDWSLIRAFVEGRLKLEGDIDQSQWFYAWCKVAYESLVTGSPGNYTPGHILVMAGSVGGGKSRLQTNIITPLLGGREGDPTPFLTGEDIFNSDLMESEHWAMDELKGASQKTVDRVALSESMKAIAVEEKKRMRLMRTNPVTVYPFIRLTLTMNSATDKMRAFPLLTPDFKDKVLMLQVGQAPLPMPTETPAEKKAFNDAVAAQMPAFCHWLLHEYTIPPELLVDAQGKRQTRFGFAAWQHPELAEALYDDTPHAQLLRMIDDAWLEHKINGPKKLWELGYPHNKSGAKSRGGDWVNEPGVWQGSAEDLEKLLCGEVEGIESSVAKAALKLCRFGDMAHRLSSLKEDKSDRVDNCRTNKSRHWRIGATPVIK